MKKLKTLKDIKLSYDYDTDCNLKEELKAEAIIWVKETKKYKGEFSFGSAQDWIKHFFNITDEDLK